MCAMPTVGEGGAVNATGLISSSSAVVAQDLRYLRDGVPLLDGVDLTVAPGERVAIVDPDGLEAPTALLQIISGLTIPQAGWVHWGGRDLLGLRDSARSMLRRRDVGIALDSSGLLPELPVLENIALPLMLDGLGHRAAVGRAADLLDDIGLTGKGARRLKELDCTGRMLVVLGRALVIEPALVVARDATSQSDGASPEAIDVLLQGCSRVGAALLLATDSREVAARCDRTLRLVDGRLGSRHDLCDAREALL